MTPETMIRAIRALPDQAPPSAVNSHGFLGGLDYVTARVAALLDKPQKQAAG